LKLVVTNLLISRRALFARPASTDKRQRYTIADPPPGDVFSTRLDYAGDFMTGNMWQTNVPIVTHPAMPVTSTDAGGLDLQDGAIFRRIWIRHVFDIDRTLEFFVNSGFHSARHDQVARV
jgi:hypothetical protein